MDKDNKSLMTNNNDDINNPIHSSGNNSVPRLVGEEIRPEGDQSKGGKGLPTRGSGLEGDLDSTTKTKNEEQIEKIKNAKKRITMIKQKHEAMRETKKEEEDKKNQQSNDFVIILKRK